jgi:two-component system chemotaxis response regulator CheB
MAKIRVLVVDDSSVVRRMVSDVLASDPEIEIIGSAPNGRIALAKLAQLGADAVTLDVEMPEMDGIATLEAIRKVDPRVPVIMFSSRTERAAQATVEALLRGATDYATKPTDGTGEQVIRQELIPKVKASVAARRAAPAPLLPPATTLERRPRIPDVVAIGVSTGGPQALSRLFADLAKPLPVPMVLVQHMPATFTRILAERLTTHSVVPVHEARDGDRLVPGEAWLAPGDFHMTVTRRNGSLIVQLDQEPPQNSCRPAVDVLFRSVAEVFGRGVLALVMTGMGQDGCLGAERIHSAGGSVWVQDEATSVVWGMPGSVVRAGLAEKVIPIEQMGRELTLRVARAEVSRPATA